MRALLLVALLVVIGCAAPAPTTAPPAASPTTPPAPPPATTAPPAVSPALQALRRLPVRPSAPYKGYRRDLFGPVWFDVDGNGCDTRNEVLRRDLTGKRQSWCWVYAGTLRDPYSGRTVSFERGWKTSGLVEIDHVVSLFSAWQTGARGWPPRRRLRFANDLGNLLAVSRASNQDKDWFGADRWLPPDKAFRCAYVARQVAVKRRWGLWVLPKERPAMERVLHGCPAQRLPF